MKYTLIILSIGILIATSCTKEKIAPKDAKIKFVKPYDAAKDTVIIIRDR